MSKRSHNGKAKNNFLARRASESAQSSEKVFEIRLGVFQLIVVVVVSILLVSILYTYAAAWSGVRPLQQSDELTIENVITQDAFGNPKSNFIVGDIVVVNVTLTYPPNYGASPLGFLQISEIFEPPTHDLVISIGFVQAPIRQGDELSAATSWRVPAGATQGAFMVKIFVWNTWPIYPGWTRLAESTEIYFTVS